MSAPLAYTGLIETSSKYLNFCFLAAFMLAAMAMLWGVLRIARRHHPVALIETDSTGRSETSHLSAAS